MLQRKSSAVAIAWAAPKQKAHMITSGHSEHQYPNPSSGAVVLTPGQLFRGEGDAAGHGPDKLPDGFI